VIARDSIAGDGTSRALGAGERAHADPSLTEALIANAPSAHVGTIASVDLFYETGPRRSAHEALAIEMEAAALFTVGATAEVPVACVLAVSDTFDSAGERERIDDDSLLSAAEAMGAVAVAALAA
jgi:nucleoside phosphorylase